VGILAVLVAGTLVAGACGRTEPAPPDPCDGGLARCGDECRDTLVDDANCGACGNPCRADQVCEAGVCKARCAPDRTFCTDRCADLGSDFFNCGGCGHACQSTETCTAARCVTAPPCRSGLTLCNGQCVNLLDDRDNCGRCAQPCNEYLCNYCVDGFCAQTAGVAACDPTACTDTGNDPANCGGCGNACPATQVCDHDPSRGFLGSCLARCEPGHTSCNGRCIDTQTDALNCGRCGNACPACQVCSKGQCTSGAGVLRCGRSCESLQLRPGVGVCSACSTTCDTSGLACQRCLY
jgi:stigma-specific protein Stig1